MEALRQSEIPRLHPVRTFARIAVETEKPKLENKNGDRKIPV